MLCNVCNHSHKIFVNSFPSKENQGAINRYQVIAGYGENIICPYCLSTARERLVILMLQQHFNLQQKKVLHFSPEKNISEYIRRQTSDLVSADLHPGFYRNVDKQVQEQNLLELKFEDNSFDLVMANHVMEHIPNDLLAMKEIYRVLKPGGRAVLQIPFSNQLTKTIEQNDEGNPVRNAELFGQKDHVRIYHPEDYITRLQSVGFHVEVLKVSELTIEENHALQEQELFFMISKS